MPTSRQYPSVIPGRHYPPVYAPVAPGALLQALIAHALPRALHRAQERAGLALSMYAPEGEVILTDSGTSALSLALSVAMANTCGDHKLVAMPAYVCPDVATAAIANQMGIVLYDLDPHTLQPDWNSVERCLATGAAVLVLTHLFGTLVDIPLGMRMASAYGAVVVEDAAQGAGGTWHGVPAGALGAIATMSFGRGKGLNAGGGGALLLDVASASATPATTALPFRELAGQSRVRSLAAWAQAAVAELLSSPLLYGIPAALPLGLGETVYHRPAAPRSISLSSATLLPAAIGGQSTLADARRHVNAWYREELAEVTGLLLAAAPDACIPGALRTPVRLSPARGADLSRFGVARSYPRTVAEYREVLPYIRHDMKTPGARELASCLHTLPTHQLLSHADRCRLVQALRTA